jgi:chromosome segregation ATPase
VERVDRADRLTQRIESQEVRLETGAKSIAGLAKQVQAVASRLTELQAQSSRIDESISRVTAKPQEIIAAAKDQAVHLESVCSAVRKVFAGLSKTTIESKKHKDAFEAVSHEAGTRLTQLKTETDRAARTLHQWVEEASRAQARLAETLGQVPSIAETHGADALTRLAGAAFAGPIKSMPAEEGLRMGSPSQGVDTVTGMFDDTDGNDAADEVARMIEEAKRAPVAGRS